MAHIQDRWKTDDGQPTARHGKGKRWRARLVVAGRETSRSFDRKTDAQAWLALQETRLNQGEYVSPKAGQVTFDEVAGQWLQRPDIRQSTRERDAAYLRAYISPAIGSLAVGKVTPDHIDRLVADLFDDGGGLAASTVAKASQIVAGVLRDAVRRDLIARTPHRGIRLPKAERDPVQFLTADEVLTVADHLGDFAGMALLGGFGGLRLGEVIALTGEHVDRDRRTVTIAATASDLSDGVRVTPPKTQKARRTIALPASVVDVLPDTDGLLWTDSAGGVLRRRNWARRYWKPATTAAGFDGLRFHDLRHSHVALLIELGEDPKAIADRLGHKSVRTVLDVYGHLYEDHDHDTAARIEGLLTDDAATVTRLHAG